uniref:RIC3 domain-containing protein n=1 Tax=Caenorhabditis japonica TaxID=281687 RepID=A0A8R1E2F6_CAEJA
MGFLGRGQPTPSINQQRPPVHPAMGGGGGPRHPGGHPSRPDVHPAMRMAQAQAESQSGGSKGMFTWMLPVYTIGVVLFLLYTLFKSKKKDKKRRKNVYLESEDDDDSESERETKFGGKFGKKKLRGLQERLRQTEDAMAKILEQLESVQAGPNPVDLDAAEKIADQLEEDDGVSAKQAVGLTEKNESYIKDLEVALKEFQTLSAVYDKEKRRKLRKNESSSDEDDEEEEEVGSSEMSEIEEEEEEEVEKTKKQKKIRQKNTSEEEEEEHPKKNFESEEEEGIDIDSELREQEQREKKSVRRRRAKKT